MEETRPAPELLLAQLVLSAILLFLVGHATYEGEYPIPEFKYEVHWGRPVFLEDGQRRGVVIREFRAAYTVLLLMAVSSAYFFTNLLLYATLKLMRDPLPLYKKTTLILTQDVIFCFLMFVCSIGAVSHPGERAVKNRETEILIASGISIFCCVSSGVGVYYSYKLYKGL